jgi:hypothetical protein
MSCSAIRRLNPDIGADDEMIGNPLPLYICLYIHTYMHTCIHAYMHACMHACMHAYIHTRPLLVARSHTPTCAQADVHYKKNMGIRAHIFAGVCGSSCRHVILVIHGRMCRYEAEFSGVRDTSNMRVIEKN